MKFSIDLTMIQDKQLKELDCLIYAIADSLSQNGQFKLSYNNFIKLINRNKMAAENSLDRLAKAGYIEYSIQNNLLQISIVSAEQQLAVMQTNQQKIIEAKKAKKAKSKSTAEQLEIVKDVIDYFNKKMNKNYRYKTYQDKIITLLKNNYTKDELIQVIDTMYSVWINDNYMNQFIRPSTLFMSSKQFDKYLNTAPKKSAAESKMDKYKSKDRTNSDSINGWG